MKIGIITFNRAINYGAVLQSYALKNKLVSMGHDCEVLNYYSEAIEKGASPYYIKSKSPKDILIFLLQIGMRKEKNKKFLGFAEKYLDVTDNILTRDNIKEYAKDFDLLITGSDQVWNYELTYMDENYFLSFADKNTKKASYAASFGVNEIPKEYQDIYKRLLSDIDVLSVREKVGQDIIEGLTGQESSLVCDPVFLLKKQEWEKIIPKPKTDEEYIAVYALEMPECYDIAKKISDKTGLKIVGIQAPMKNKVNCQAERRASPEEFLSWIKNAKYVVTNSFHGTSFSIIFNKKFVSFNGGIASRRFSRQRTLIESTGLMDRVCTLENWNKIFDDIDYSEVNKHVEDMRNNGIGFLNKLVK